ncbi:glycosyltransferase family 4 protein [Acidocella sp.]|uniref:glycosyltransferase family 4 protein n=1 Tax=Acidocella sp. TaxID=50710 RepID=UPI003D063A80
MSEPLLLPAHHSESIAAATSDNPISGRLLCAMRYGALGASSRLRLAQYAPFLRQVGLDVTLRPFLRDDYLNALYTGRSRTGAALGAYCRALSVRAEIAQHDLLWIEKELLPWLPYWLERGLLGDTPYILDFDDAWALRYAQSSSSLVKLLLRNKFGNLLRQAALTIVANDTLYRWAVSEGARNILLLPTVIDPARYQPTPLPGGPFTIGWIGTPLTATYLHLLAAPLRLLSQEGPLKLLVIGAPGFTMPGVDVESLPWTEASEAMMIGKCHAGIMPLPDTEWANGKSGYKLIQYMAMARPAIASAIGANNRIVHDGETGFLAHTPDDWLAYLRQLRANPDLAARMGAAARLRVEQHYSLAVTAPILTETLSELLGNIAAHKVKTRFAARER